MRAGRVRPGAHDHEVHGGVPLGEDRLGDDRADGPLGQPGPQPARDLRVHPVDGGAGLAQGGDLGRALPDPQGAQRAAGQRQPRAGQRVAELQHGQRPHPVRQADRGDGPEAVRDQGERVVGLLPGDHLQVERPGRGGLGRGQFQPRHEQHRLRAGRDRQAGQPLQLLGVVADGVPQVGPGRQQHGIEAGRSGRLPDLLEPVRGIQFVGRHDIDASAAADYAARRGPGPGLAWRRSAANGVDVPSGILLRTSCATDSSGVGAAGPERDRR